MHYQPVYHCLLFKNAQAATSRFCQPRVRGSRPAWGFPGEGSRGSLVLEISLGDFGQNPGWERQRHNGAESDQNPQNTQISRDTLGPGQRPALWIPSPRCHARPSPHRPPTKPRVSTLSRWCGSTPSQGGWGHSQGGRWKPVPGAQHFELITATSSHGFSGEKHSLAVISSLIIRHGLVPNKLNSFTLRQSPRNQTNHLSQQDAAFKNQTTPPHN